MKRNLLLTFCLIGAFYTLKVIVGLAGLQQTPPASLWGIALEVGTRVIACGFPLYAILGSGKPPRAWQIIIWAPCILYLVATSVIYLIRFPALNPFYLQSVARTVVWIGIAILYFQIGRGANTPANARSS